ncbi:MAG TPA: alkaline phosphatase family protein [Prosthecobacter sp.]
MLFRPLLLACTLGLLSAASAANKENHVVLISLDGFPAWMWKDPSLPVPNLRKLAAEGAQTEAMTVSNPSITWINHTTMVTGVNPQKHGVLFNGLLVRQEGGKPPKLEPWVHKNRLVHVPTIYDIAHKAGLTTAEVDWVAIKDAETISWSFEELPDASRPIEKEMIAAGLLTEEQVSWMTPGPQRKNMAFHDLTWTKAAGHIIKTHKPNLLLYHTLNTDGTHHRYGPANMASYTALAYTDRLVGDLVKSVEDAGLRESTTFFIATDHGFKKVTKFVYPNVALKKAGYAKGFGNAITQCEVAAMPQGGLCFIYVLDPAKKAELLPKLKELFAATEGVDKVMDGNEGPTLGMPTPVENQGMGDLILYAKAGYAFNNGAAGEAVAEPSVDYGGTHGYPNSDPELDGIFIASGKGVKKGIVLPRMANLDIAPTMARILGIQLPDTDGRVLEEILEKK